MSLALRYVAHSEIGLVRKNNQDSAYVSPTMLVVADGMGGHLSRSGDRSHELLLPGVAKEMGQTNRWGDYAPAIARWEAALGRTAPSPTEPGAKGGHRLSPRFVEWMQGLPAGHVTDVPDLSRNNQLKALGNGVVPQQCAAAYRAFLADEMEAAA